MLSINFTYMDNIPKGHLTVMWTQLFKKAYSENCDYFFSVVILFFIREHYCNNGGGNHDIK
jgi:hypothetical protein